VIGCTNYTTNFLEFFLQIHSSAICRTFGSLFLQLDMGSSLEGAQIELKL